MIIAISNHKGGTGKTATTLCLGAALQQAGAKVLYIDLDPQGNLSYITQADTAGRSIFGALAREAAAADAVQQTTQGAVIAASDNMVGADVFFAQQGGAARYLLREALEPLKREYDFILLDTPPALNILTIQALTAADGVLIPAQADALSLQGISKLYNTIAMVRQPNTNPALKVYGIVLTRYNARSIISKTVVKTLEQAAAGLQTRLFETKVRECTAIKEAQAAHKSLYDYAPKSNAAADYKGVAAELRGIMDATDGRQD